ncbi:MAG: hypothetical protein AB1671_16790 [Thermodesulfobacteriota bacterium]|jgi:hypothetical protein
MRQTLQGTSGTLFDPFPLSEAPPLTPYDVAAEKGQVRLRYYRAGG